MSATQHVEAAFKARETVRPVALSPRSTTQGDKRSDDEAATWLQRPNRELNGELPIRLLDTDVGARQVEDILGRLGARDRE